jgi:ribose transport system ATP-binding protein
MTAADNASGRAVTARLRGVHKSYGQVRVLDLPELDLYAGQVVGVVGENGAGKSTLIGTLAGSVRRDGGEIEIGGTPLVAGSTEAAGALGVALVSQEFPLVGQLSVAENLLPSARRPRRCWSRSACPPGPSRSPARCARCRCRPAR